MDIKALAELVKDKIDPDKRASLPAPQQHILKAAEAVAAELGVEPDAVNIHQIANLIEKHMELDYPRMVYLKSKPEGVHFEPIRMNTPSGAVTVYGVTVASEKEESELEGAHPDPHSAAGLKPAEVDHADHGEVDETTKD